MNVGAILDFVAGELDSKVVAYMQEYAIPPSLMDKVLDRIQSHMRQMKSEEYAQELTQMQLEAAVQQSGTETAGISPEPMQEKREGTKTQTIEEFKKEMEIGGSSDADIQRTEGKQG